MTSVKIELVPEKEIIRAWMLALNDWRDYVMQKSQEYVPKDDGDLQSSGRVTIDDDRAKEISYGGIFGVNYAGYVEFGTPMMEAAHGRHNPKNPVKTWKAKRKRAASDDQQMPYLRPAYYEANSKLGKWVGKYVEKLKNKRRQKH